MKVNCANSKCSKEIDRLPSQIKRSKTGNCFCSKSCANTVNNTLFKSGENHPNYKLGSGSYRERKLKEMEFCETCGITDIRVLEVHHIDCNRSNNELSNLMTLCANCHKIEHHKKKLSSD